ncbi:MAG: hypothetical protein HY898_35980 [Deltaproteobacteria bacterium]|nr:hypothetical protein [Deltaproteobacteria bacterium]
MPLAACPLPLASARWTYTLAYTLALLAGRCRPALAACSLVARLPLQGAFTLTSEAAARTGDDRACRFRWARAEANEAAAVLEALARLRAADPQAAASVIAKLWRLSAMLTRLAMPKR